MVKTTDALNGVTTFNYDAVGNILSQTDANGHTSQISYDALNRPVQQTDPAGNVTYLVYNDSNHEVRAYRGWNSSTGTPHVAGRWMV